ncbi:methylmalonyl CoA mutase-associated GTPase [Skeletonema marinoi]|uniref:Methylmalonyl CoA mutase-associated GTPase n=1 Tax=Skeletonema marinoi TaxID=267567 RepID=A0AAD9DG31_9STRA|nr:methylmalonyl CoA mutase-associated GTPase [Skeletonema marinoi]
MVRSVLLQLVRCSAQQHSLNCNHHQRRIGSIFITTSCNRGISSLSEEDDKTVDRLAHDILGKPRSDDGDGYKTSSQTMRQRIALSKSITLVESKSLKHRKMADSLLDRLMKDSSNTNTFRLGICGPPGVGKSSIVEALGLYILGLDKNEQEDAFCQKGVLGGLGAYTYDAASLCEFANYELTIIETVGVGQSEVELAECCDLFLLLLAPGGGDELQGSKKGIVEVADVLVVNKADGELHDVARKTANEYKKAVGLLRKPAGWWGTNKNDHVCSDDRSPATPPVLLCSARTGLGIPELWDLIKTYRQNGKITGYIDEKRRNQRRYWLTKYLREHVLEAAKNDAGTRKRKEEIELDLDNVA